MKLEFGWILSLAERRGDTVRLPVVPIGEFVYKGQVLNITEEEANTIAGETSRLLETIDQQAVNNSSGVTPWRPPVIREHTPDGRSFGRVVEVDADSTAVWATVEFTEPTWAEIERGEVQWFSPKLVPNYVDQWGNVYRRVILEVSLTTNPKLKHIGRVQDYIQLSEGLIMEDEETQGGATEETSAPAEDTGGDIETRLATLEEVVAILVEKIENMKPAEMSEDAPKDEGQELSDNGVSRLESRIVELSDKLDKIASAKPPVRFMTVERGNAGPPPAPKNREEELRKSGLSGSDLAAKLLGWE